MAKALVAYYSRTGHTRQVAEVIAAQLGADVEPIQDVRPRSGLLGYWRSGCEALHKTAVGIEPVEKDPDGYDLVVLGTPVWAGRMSSPLRAYINAHRANFARVAVFCTEGGASGEKAMRQVAELCDRLPVATLIVTERELGSGAFRQKVADFTHALG